MSSTISFALTLIVVGGIGVIIFEFFLASHLGLISRRPRSSLAFEKRPETRSGFCVQYNYTTADIENTPENIRRISLCAHSTANYLTLVVAQAAAWNAPISLSLLLDGDSKKALDDVQRAQKCDANFRKWVSVHIVYPKSLQDSCTTLPINENLEPNCAAFDAASIFSKYRPPFGIYPINVMRNVARVGAATDYQLVSDVEMYYSEGFEEKLRPTADQHLSNGQKNALIIRRYEIESYVKHMPKNVTRLKTLLAANKMYFFHQVVFSAGHFIDEQGEWIEKSINEINITTKEHKYRGNLWEPQPILHRNAPLCYERAPTRHRDMQYCIYELCRAGYHFLVPTHVFNVHPGVKRSSSNFDMLVTNHQKPLTANAVAEFSRLMDERYGKEGHSCGSFFLGQW